MIFKWFFVSATTASPPEGRDRSALAWLADAYGEIA
jgi:hypothetical protein